MRLVIEGLQLVYVSIYIPQIRIRLSRIAVNPESTLCLKKVAPTA